MSPHVLCAASANRSRSLRALRKPGKRRLLADCRPLRQVKAGNSAARLKLCPYPKTPVKSKFFRSLLKAQEAGGLAPAWLRPQGVLLCHLEVGGVRLAISQINGKQKTRSGRL